MNSSTLENSFLKIFKRLILITIGSGLISNALYIYGLGYYEGFIKRLGFQYELFPIQWNEALLWTYAASRELGLKTIYELDNVTGLVIITLVFGIYIIARLWMEISNIETKQKNKSNKKINYKIAKKIYYFREKHIWLFRFIYIPLRWVLLKEQSFIAFMASYFFIVFIVFIPIFIIIWVYFPLIGLSHGENVASKRLDYYENNLCGGDNDYWSTCLSVIPDENLVSNKEITGRLLFKNNNLLGILTDLGPVTVTMPKIFFHKRAINSCFKNGCKKDARKPNK